MANEIKQHANGNGHGANTEVLVNETTPQGTQDNSVEYGHDERDIFVGSIMRWLISLGIGVAIILSFLIGLFTLLNHSYTSQEEPPAKMFRGNQLPPEPRIEAMMIRDNHGDLRDTSDSDAAPRPGTPEELKVVRAGEEKKLESFGLKRDEDKQDDPQDADRYGFYHPLKISPAMVASVAKENPPAGQQPASLKASEQAFSVEGPSDASGGLRVTPNRYVQTNPLQANSR